MDGEDLVLTSAVCPGECINDSECPLHRACFDFNCRSPCENACGQNAECQAR